MPGAISAIYHTIANNWPHLHFNTIESNIPCLNVYTACLGPKSPFIPAALTSSHIFNEILLLGILQRYLQCIGDFFVEIAENSESTTFSLWFQLRKYGL